jgi:TolB-like protein
MKSVQTYNVLLKVFLLTGIVFFSACGGDNIVTSKPPNLSGIEKILILPFKDMAAVFGESENGRCPLCGKVFTTGEVAESAADMLTEQLFILLKDRKNIELIPSSQAQGVMSGLLAGSKKMLREQDLQLEIGRVLNADAIFAGYVYRFRERVGAQYSVDVPASVAFDIHLIRVEDGRVLWSAHLDETQQPLSDDLFRLKLFLRRKAKWITAKEMAFSGLEDMLKDFYIPTGTETETFENR